MVAMAFSLLATPVVAEPRYQVEVIVFETLPAAPSPSGPQPPAAPATVDDSAAIDPSELPSTALLLREAVQRLDKSGRYRTLLHLGWRQNALQIQPVRIGDRPGSDETGVSGVASVKIGQQLAMQLSLVCHVDGGSAWLQARRTVRPGELHYIDHRLCGALVQVTRVRETVE